MRKFEQVSYAQGVLPTRADIGSAGYDFYAPEKTIIKPGEIALIKTNIKAQMNINEVLLIFVRSSVGIKRQLILANNTGVIDSTYYNNPDNEGNIIVALYNYGTTEQTIEANERIAQGVFLRYLETQDDITNKTYRTGGIGSTGA